MGTDGSTNRFGGHELPRIEHEEEVMLLYEQEKGWRSKWRRHTLTPRCSSRGTLRMERPAKRDNSIGSWEPTTPTAPRVEYSLGRLAGREAAQYSKLFEEHSKLASKIRRNLTSLRWSDLEIGKLIGTGNFSHVYEVKVLRKKPIVDDCATVITSCQTISTNVWDVQSKWNDPRYNDRDMWDLVSVDEGENSESDSEGQGRPPEMFALKHLHPSVATSEGDFTSSVIDLVFEAKLLTSLAHENIVRLHAVTEGAISSVFCGGGYFLLLDRLSGTLEDKIEGWRQEEEKANQERHSSISLMWRRLTSSSRSCFGSSTIPSSRDEKNVTPPHIKERLRFVALGVARGLEYLHAHRIVFRDMKPCNVGFYRGVVKIFDFGLAREILEGDEEQRMTAKTGSLRYMSPEVYLGLPYGLPCDIYSYGIMLWELVTLLTPFRLMTTTDHAKHVICGRARPKVSLVPGKNLQYLMQACWHADAQRRPTSTGVRNALMAQLASARRESSTSNDMSSEQQSAVLGSGGPPAAVPRRHSRLCLLQQPRRRSATRYRYRDVDDQKVG